MEYYFVTKWLHILSATLMFGTGFGTAFYMFVTNRSGNVQAISVVSQWVVRADWWFTTPSIIFQPISGLLMAHWLGYPYTSYWLVLSMVLYLVAGACWLPVVWLQLKMRDMAQIAARDQMPLPERYWRFERIWTILGFPAFISLMVVYWLMVSKPF